jgi:hypothetical protein
MELLKSLCQEQEIHCMVIKHKFIVWLSNTNLSNIQTNMTFKWAIFYSYTTDKKTVAFCDRC